MEPGIGLGTETDSWIQVWNLGCDVRIISNEQNVRDLMESRYLH